MPVDNSTVPPFRTVPQPFRNIDDKSDQTVPPFPPYKGERGTVEQLRSRTVSRGKNDN
jgi:hypothetical protein